MGLIGNYSVLSKSPGQFRSGTTISADRSNFNKSGALKNRFAGQAFVSNKTAIPNGYSAPYSWAIAQKSGGLATYKSLNAAISLSSAGLASGINIDGSIAASISITTAQLDQIVSLMAALGGSISATSADLAAIAGLEASLSASISITSSQLDQIISLTASLGASIGLTDANVVALFFMEAEIGGPAELSPEGLAEAVSQIEIESGFNFKQVMRLISSALAGKISGAPGTSIIIRDVNDAIDRIAATVDSNGNRESIVLDVSDV